jgi:hypothetical protein
MKRINNKPVSIKVVGIILLTVCLLFFTFSTFADYDLSWHTIDGGGGVSSGSQYIVMGTIAQHDASYSQGGQYELLGGFWPGEPLCFVEFEDFAVFAQQWLFVGGGLDADLSGDNDVDSEDLGLFSDEWLYWCPYTWPLK